MSAITIFSIVSLISFEIAAAVFIAAIGPTAIASPVIISLKNRDVKFVLFSLLLENTTIALLIPFLLPLLMGSYLNISFSKIMLPVIVTLFMPLVSAQLIKYLSKHVWKVLVGWKGINFYLLIGNIYIASSKASYYIRNESPEHYSSIYLIGVFVVITCIFLFTLGKFIGGKKYREEASYSLGQKNNGFTIWIALTYMNPIAVIGPVFYVLFQNIYISFDLYKQSKTKTYSTLET